MNKKKLLTMVLALVLIGAVGVGATLAYFTDNDSATNVVTMGHVDIVLTEDEWTHGDEGIKDVTPGQEIKKDPTITLGSDSLDALVRVKVEVVGFEKAKAKNIDVTPYIDAINNDISLQAAENGWTYNNVDKYYYYNKPLTNKTENENVAVLFETITIPTTWNNDVADNSFDIIVSAEAIQADNLATDFDKLNWNMTTEQILKYEPTPAAGSGENAGETTQQ